MQKNLPLFFFLTIIISACGPVTCAPGPTALIESTASLKLPTTPTSPTPVTSDNPAFEPITPANASRLEEIARWGDGDIYGAAVSPDQKSIAIYTAKGISLLDSQSLETIRTFSSSSTFGKLRDHYYGVNDIAFSPDGKYLAIADHDWLGFWNISGPEIKGFPLWVPDLQPSRIEYSPNGKFIIVTSRGGNAPCDGVAGNLALYSITGSLVFSRYSCPPFPDPWKLTTNNKFLYINRNFREEQTYLTTIDLTLDVPDKISFVPLGKFGYFDGWDIFSPDGAFLKITETKDKKPYTTILQTSPIKSVDVVEGEIEFVQAANGTYSWKPRAPQPQNKTLPCNLDPFRYTILLKNAERAVIDAKNQFEVLDLQTCQTIKKVQFTTGSKPIVFSLDGSVFAEWDENHIDMMTVDNRSLLSTISVDSTQLPIGVIGLNTDGSRIVTGLRANLYEEKTKDKNYELSVWDTHTGMKTQTLTSTTTRLEEIISSPDKNIIVVKDSAGFGFWDIQQDSLLQTIPASMLTFHPNGDLVAAGSDEKIEISNFRTGKILQTISLPKREIRKIFFNRDGSKLLIGVFDWNTRNTVLMAFNTNTGKTIYQVEFDKGFQTVTGGDQSELFALRDTSCDGGKIEIWDFEHNQPVLTIPDAHLIKTEQQDCASYSSADLIAFNKTGQILLSLEDDQVRLRDVQTGLLLNQIKPDFGVGRDSFRFSPDGKFIFISNTDGIIRIWGVRKP